MPSITFKVKYKINQNLVYSASELLASFMHGISLKDRSGSVLGYDVIEQKIRFAQSQIENTLYVKLFPYVLSEGRDFIRSDYAQWGFSKYTYPIKAVLDLDGFLGTTKQISFPEVWVSIDRTSEEALLNRTLHIVPSGVNAETISSVVYAGITPHVSFYGLASIPNYWKLKYITGFDNIPADLSEAIGKIATIPVLSILGDILLGAGIAAQSLSYDGLSQSIQTTQSAENSAYSARIRQYMGELKQTILALINHYKGITIAFI